MVGVLEGFGTIAVVVALGWVLAHLRVLDTAAQNLLSRLAFYVASPALLIVVMARTPIGAIFSANLVSSFGSVVVTVAIYLAIARWRWRAPLGDRGIARSVGGAGGVTVSVWHTSTRATSACPSRSTSSVTSP